MKPYTLKTNTGLDRYGNSIFEVIDDKLYVSISTKTIDTVSDGQLFRHHKCLGLTKQQLATNRDYIIIDNDTGESYKIDSIINGRFSQLELSKIEFSEE